MEVETKKQACGQPGQLTLRQSVLRGQNNQENSAKHPKNGSTYKLQRMDLDLEFLIASRCPSKKSASDIS